ncbi:MAG: four helix bundle protein [Bacteroidota bacterium]
MTIDRVEQLRIYQRAFEAAMDVFEWSKQWPREERYALTDQARRSSRAVCANLSEAWAKRRYPKHFVSKLSDAHGEAEETLTWLRFAHGCGYLLSDAAEKLISRYRQIIAGLVRMMASPESWCLPDPVRHQS